MAKQSQSKLSVMAGFSFCYLSLGLKYESVDMLDAMLHAGSNVFVVFKLYGVQKK